MRLKAGGIAADLFRRESARLVSMLVGQFGTHRLQLAEDVVQEALVRALESWPYRGIPENPAAWLTQTAKNLAVDQVRRERSWNTKTDKIAREHPRWLACAEARFENADTFNDDTLRMLFVCFHPQLSQETQVALALRTLCGFSPAEIASAYFSTEAAIEKRLVRARQRIRELRLPFVVPAPHELPSRLEGVLATLHLLFNEGYKASTGDRLVREELCQEALRLCTHLAAHPATNQPKTHALLALMLLTSARLPARLDDTGVLLRLHEQDRAKWDRTLIERGVYHLSQSACGEHLSEYHLQAGIAACHGLAASDATTDWPRILNLYDRLVQLNASPLVRLNRIVALAKAQGTTRALEELDALAATPPLPTYHLYHAVRGNLLEQEGKTEEAADAYRRAEQLAPQTAEQDFLNNLQRRLVRSSPASPDN